MQIVNVRMARCASLWIILITTVLLSTACGLAGNNTMLPNAADDYLDAHTLKPIKVPPNLDSHAIGQAFKVPVTDVLVAVEDPAVPSPPRLIMKKDIPRVSIQQLGEQRWILVAQSAAKTWPLVVNFLKTNRLTIVSSDIDKGLLETDWLTLSIDPGNVNKYFLRVDSGVQPDTTEIHITNHVHSDRESRRTVQLTRVSADQTRENWMINELVEALTSESDALPGESLLAQNVGSGDKVYLSQRQNELVLAIGLDKSRAYASLVEALAQSGEFILYQHDPVQGVFHIDYSQNREKENSTGFTLSLINSLNPFKPEKRLSSQHALEDIIAHLPEESSDTDRIFTYTPSTVLDDVPGYLIVIKDDDSKQIVYIRDGYGKPLPLSQSKQLLTLIRRQLI